MSGDTTVHDSTGNIFEDLGLPNPEEHERASVPGTEQFRPDITDRLVSIFRPAAGQLRGSDHIGILRGGDTRRADEQDGEWREGSREFGEGEPHDDLQKEDRLEFGSPIQ